MTKTFVRMLLVVLAICVFDAAARAQTIVTVLTGAQLTRVVPTGFYFEGQSAPTQMRNTAAARFGVKRHVIAGLVDTSGYSADVRAKYEGFFIADAPVTVGGKELGAGAYGFGFTDDSKFNLFDVGGRPVLSTSTADDRVIKRPRPLMMVKDEGGGVRLYSGRQFVLISVQ